MMASFVLAWTASPGGRAYAAPPEAALAAVPLPPPPPPAPAPRGAPPIAIALTAGVATALIPLALGTAHTAGAISDGSRDVGYVVAGAGFALAPIVAHAALGEWKRAAAFGAVPVASEIAIIGLVSAVPDAVFHRTQGSRTAFALLFSADVFGAALGLVDVMLAGERARAAPVLHGLTVVPSVGRDHAGLVIGGML
jgi:hypothetical protein